MAAMQLTRTHRILIGVVVTGAVLIAAIGFAGSYAAVRELAEEKGFGDFSLVFPIGIDAGICVLLALDLLLTWMRIPFPLLRQTAWLLTIATIAFNGAASWPDPLGVGMHAVIPVLFVVSVEAARHAVGRIADITADKHMDGVRLTRWLLSPLPTFKLWRRMKLWELRSYEQVIKLEQDRLIYQARLQARFGRAWRRKAPVESLMPLRLARYGVPLSETGPAGLAAAGIEPALLPPVAQQEPQQAQQQVQQQEQVQVQQQPQQEQPQLAAAQVQETPALPAQASPQPQPQPQPLPQEHQQSQQSQEPQQSQPQPLPQPQGRPQGPQAAPAEETRQDAQQDGAPAVHASPSPWFAAPQVPQEAYEGAYDPAYVEPAYAEEPETAPVMVPSGPGRTRPLGGIPGPRNEQAPADYQEAQRHAEEVEEEYSAEETYYNAFRKYVSENSTFPTARQLGSYLHDLYSQAPVPGELAEYNRRFEIRYQQELDAEHIA
ncbi:DUF2637 domain-containing protein [Streptomyces sp. H27-C3]|uniref:DUF2637 domain-containing protein n=1 Tax=Streptomyces sp. H27-C3 TaxID=3046305 RepID=UPI0024BA24CA|nr:DUF2637 domain-containing protein [Streptomyces sp. H27-C3]MDJ0465602.1 DUF2637 domain-containing protein [Streptomyces sp. H27-C3]